MEILFISFRCSRNYSNWKQEPEIAARLTKEEKG